MTTPTPTAFKSDFLREMSARGQIHQATDPDALDKHLDIRTCGTVRRAYAGFDPTADSLTIGNLVPIMVLARFQRAGHQPVAVMGGGTGLIGDPSGKSAERTLQTAEMVQANVESIKKSFGNILDFTPSTKTSAIMLNNADWLSKLGYLEALRDIGKHFSVNQMIVRDSVKDRLHNREQGISYTEFSYMILQAYDYAHLHKAQGVTLQMGGSDQWGNILSGCDLIRRYNSESAASNTGATEHAVSFALTWPLVTKADGGKFGKTESGAIWLSAHRTSPYAYYQFWLNAADADVGNFLKTYTFLPVPEIAALIERHAANPGAREAQRTLAREATAILHGPTERDRAEAAAAALFSGDIAQLPLNTLLEVLASAPTTTHDKSLLAGEGRSIIELLASTSLAKSKGEAKQFLTDGSVSINGQKATMADRVTIAHLLHGQIIALRRGKKNWHVTRWQ